MIILVSQLRVFNQSVIFPSVFSSQHLSAFLTLPVTCPAQIIVCVLFALMAVTGRGKSVINIVLGHN
jgi:hypothetical protein